MALRLRMDYYLRKEGLIYLFIYLLTKSSLKDQILGFVHSSEVGDQLAYYKILHRLKLDFIWASMRKDIKTLIKECVVC